MYAEALAPNHTPSALPHWLRLNEAAPIYRVSVATLRREIYAGRLKHARVGGRKSIRLRPEWLDEWLERTAAPVK